MHVWNKAMLRYAIKMNVNKTKVMAILQENQNINLDVEGIEIEGVDSY